jgi:hypothetical protein
MAKELGDHVARGGDRFAPAFDELSSEDRFGVYWIIAIMGDVCMQSHQRHQQSHRASITSRAGSRATLVFLLAHTQSPAQSRPAKKQKSYEVGTSVSSALSCMSAEFDHLKRYRPALLATVAYQILRRAAIGFISMTTSRLLARFPPVVSSGSMSRSGLTLLVLKRVFGCQLRSLVIHDIRSTFGRMLHSLPLCDFMMALQAAAASRAVFSKSLKFREIPEDADDEHAELCLIADSSVARLSLTTRDATRLPQSPQRSRCHTGNSAPFNCFCSTGLT